MSEPHGCSKHGVTDCEDCYVDALCEKPVDWRAAEQRAERAERALRRAEGRLNVIRMTLLPQLTAQADYAQAALAALPPTVQQPREEGER